MSSYMNPTLYRRLLKTFKHVRVASLGEPIRLHYRPDWYFRGGRLKAEVVCYGETYYVSCPFCSDTRQRLAVNHHWGRQEEKTGDDMLHLVRCFNESCLETREKQKELHALVFPQGVYGREMDVPIQSPKPNADAPRPVTFTLPPSVPLSSLPRRHKAIRYLEERKFDVGDLEDAWCVVYCEPSFESRPAFYEGRIGIPIYMPKKVSKGTDKQHLRLAGWQARLVESSPDGAPKYLTAYGMKRNELFYGLPQAIQAEGPVVVVEGVTDVWRVGPGAVALFGKSIAPAQCRLLRKHFQGRPIVILLDSEAKHDAEKVRKQIARIRHTDKHDSPVVLGQLPRDRSDPGDCTRSEIRQTLELALS